MTTTPAETFLALELDQRLLATLEGLGYEEPTPVQAAAIPPLLAGRDVLAQAATGTGKTAAFVLPLLQRLAASGARRHDPGALVLVPTRELALQVAEAAQRYGQQLHARVLAVYGGSPMGLQIKALQRGVDLVVATPGRALDHLRRGYLKLESLQALVLDEADEMLDLGFAEDLEAILETLPAGRQTALFSATLPARITSLASKHLKDPVELRIAPRQAGSAEEAARVRQVAFLVSRSQKPDALARLLDLEDPQAALVFCRTRTEVDLLSERLSSQGRSVLALHGGVSQSQREKVLQRFRDGRCDLLVATDVAARGLDVTRITHVVNYDVPSSPETYVHRIGRTGRAGRSGTALTLVEPRERQQLRQIEKLARRRLELGTLPTVADLRARRLALTGAALREALVAGGLERFRGLVETLAQEFDPLDVAAAGVKLFHGDEPEPAPEPPAPRPERSPRPAKAERPLRPERPAPHAQRDQAARPAPAERAARGDAPPRRKDRPVAHEQRPAPPGRETRPERPARARRPDEFTPERLLVSAGRRQGLRPADIVGALTRGAGVHSAAIGAIELGDDATLIELHPEAVEDCVRFLRREGLRGQPVSIKRQTGH